MARLATAASATGYASVAQTPDRPVAGSIDVAVVDRGVGGIHDPPTDIGRPPEGERAACATGAGSTADRLRRAAWLGSKT